MNVPQPVNAKLVLKGTLVFKDDDGNVVKTLDLAIPVTLDEPQEQANGDQRSE
jgi:hypothetical protein